MRGGEGGNVRGEGATLGGGKREGEAQNEGGGKCEQGVPKLGGGWGQNVRGVPKMRRVST